jgi:hypothetical protein
MLTRAGRIILPIMLIAVLSLIVLTGCSILTPAARYQEQIDQIDEYLATWGNSTPAEIVIILQDMSEAFHNEDSERISQSFSSLRPYCLKWWIKVMSNASEEEKNAYDAFIPVYDSICKAVPECEPAPTPTP